MMSVVYSFITLAVSPLVLLLSPLLALIAIPLTILAIFTTPIAIIILYSRVWLVYVDYFLALFYRALTRENTHEENPYSSYAPGEISRRYNMRNLQQYRYPRGHPPTTPTESPPALFSPNRILSRRNSLASDIGDFSNVSNSHQGDGGQHGHETNIHHPSRTGMDADMDSVEAWEDLASIAQHHSHRRHRSSTALASAYLKPQDTNVGALPGLAATRHPGTGFAHPHRRRRRSLSFRPEDILRVQDELEHRHQDQR